MQFSVLRLAEPILRAVASEGYSLATPIQAKTIPLAMEGRDVMGCAQTGTGKTAAFALPILHRLSHNTGAGGKRRARCLVLCPTRELATQIGESFRTYGKNLHLRSTVIFGGVGQNPQVAALRSGVEIVIATPGRLLDLMNQGHVDLQGIEVLVLDEADRMLDMGFIHDIRRITAHLPAARQTMMFSATMPREIRLLADTLLKNPASVQVAPPATTADGINESVYYVEKRNKGHLLAHLVNALPMTRAIVFTRTKRGADKVVKQLRAKDIRAEAIHSNKSQNARQRALDNFRANKIPVLVATDIASRGIDVDGITHVVNFDLSHEPETYVHRIGRTARAGASGAAVSFCDKEELPNLKGVEKLIRRSIPVKTDHPIYPARDASDDHNPQRHQHHQSRPHSQGQTHSHHASRPQSHGNSGHPQQAAHPKKPVAHPHKVGQGVRSSGHSQGDRPHHPIYGKPQPKRGTGHSKHGNRGRRAF